jgi:hypothetical protein
MSNPIENCPQSDEPICERAWTAEQVEAMAEQLNLVNLASTEHKASRMLRAYATTLRQQGESVDTAMTLEDRVEFALRDAGFDLDEASRIAALAQSAQGSETIWCMQCAKDTSYSECDNCPGNPGASRAERARVPDGAVEVLRQSIAADGNAVSIVFRSQETADRFHAQLDEAMKIEQNAAAPSRPEDAA